MDRMTPLATIMTVIDARQRGDVEAAVAAYEPTATVVLRPGQTASGESAIRAFTEAAIGLSLSFSDRRIISGDDVALHFSKWSATAEEGSGHERGMTGWTADVLRCQPDGSWLLAIDNPWAAAMLAPKPAT